MRDRAVSVPLAQLPGDGAQLTGGRAVWDNEAVMIGKTMGEADHVEANECGNVG